MTPTYKARPTLYKGIQMRSRLEALFAQTLDNAKVAWEYEPGAFADHTGQYLPDFRVGLDLYIEVKPTIEAAKSALPAMHRILATHPDAELYAVTNRGDHLDIAFEEEASCSPFAPCGDCDRQQPLPPPRITFADGVDRRTGDEEIHMLCAVCRDAHTHYEAAEEYFDSEDRLAVRLTFRCEQGHLYELNVRNHKGFSMLAAVNCRTWQ